MKPPVEVSILDVPYAQTVLLAALDLLYAVECGDDDAAAEAASVFRALINERTGG